MVKSTTFKKKLVSLVEMGSFQLLSLCMLIIIVEAQQELINEQHSPQPLASNNNAMPQPLQGQTTLQEPFANCSLATVKPTPSIGKYVFKSCIVAQFSAYLSVAPNKFVEFNNGVVRVNGSQCDDSKNATQQPKLIIDFPCASLQFTVDRTNDSKTFVSSIVGIYHFKKADKVENVEFSNLTSRFYTTHSGHYYKCNSEQTIPMEVAGNNLILSNFALEAYRDTTGTEFYQIAEECPLDSQPVSDLVRIGVGVCLVALVAIVLIAYFVGRRRWSERSSYESV